MSCAPYIPIDKPAPRQKKARKGIARFIRISQRSKKALARVKAWNKAKAEKFAETGGRCVVQSPDCTGRAEHAHHMKLRSRGGADVKENCAPSCEPCHRYLHAHPSWATARGFMLTGREAR